MKTYENDILNSASEKYLDRTARSLATLIYKESKLEAGEKRPASHAVNVCERRISQLNRVARAFNYDEEVTKEDVTKARKDITKAILTLQAQYRVLDRYYFLKNPEEVTEMISYVDSLIDRTTYYVNEKNRIAAFIQELKDRQ